MFNTVRTSGRRGAALQAAMETYLKVMLDLSATMCAGIALSLDLPRIISTATTPMRWDGPLAALSAAAGARPNPAQKGAGRAYRLGGLTLLRQGDVGGLQVWIRSAAAGSMPIPAAGTYVVNLGE